MITITKKKFKEKFKSKMYSLYSQPIQEASKDEIFRVTCSVLKDLIARHWNDTKVENDKTVFYFSMEFLIGRQLRCNLINLDIEREITEGLSELGIDINEIIEAESDPGLGNGGLGRLAACFLDSMASVGIHGHGYGIRYKYGLFEQKFVDDIQVELPDNWLKNDQYPWESVRPNKAVLVKFEGDAYLEEQEDGTLNAVHKNYIPVMAMPYDIPVIGYKNDCINTLRLWKSEIVNRDFADVSKNSKCQNGSYDDALRYKYYAEEISQVLYPNDSNYAGRLLRLKQEYFLVSAGLQDIIRKCRKGKVNIKDLYKKIAVHINDTHPTLCIPELMRILLDEEHLSWEESWDITTRVMSYTNHTILSEALEKWPIEMMKKLIPRIYMIIEEIDKRYVEYLKSKNYVDSKIQSMKIINNGEVRMAHLCVVGSHNVNGVAKLHTKILEQEVLKDFYNDQSYKFNNKTNGISHRRWLISCNEELADLISSLIGYKWISEPYRLKNLEKYLDDKEVLNKLEQVKYNNKVKLAQYIYQTQGVEIDPNAIFDVQVKRLHAYKRQLLNVLHILYLYHEILDNPEFEMYPRIFIFGAKAAPGYYLAKCIIKLINCVQRLINNDERVNKKIKVVFVENYGVSLAEKIIPAADVSEQISTTTKEASGTGNMKFMMNGALTIATLDGANVEVCEKVGEENMFIFGLKANQVLDYNKYGGYSSIDLYHNDKKMKRVVDDLINGFIPGLGTEGLAVYDSLITYNDEYFVLRDFDDYVDTQEKIDAIYRDRDLWNKMSLRNIANSGFFSSDRAIKEYIEDIWFKEV